jgi:ribosomal protein S27AE
MNNIPSAAAPHCPLHLATPMVLVKSRAPIWLVMPEGATDMEFEDGAVVKGGCKTADGGMHKKRFERKFWKCPVAGCFRVETYQLPDEELNKLRRECPRCGEPTDASAMQRAVSQFTCKKCLREQRGLGLKRCRCGGLMRAAARECPECLLKIAQKVVRKLKRRREAAK